MSITTALEVLALLVCGPAMLATALLPLLQTWADRAADAHQDVPDEAGSGPGPLLPR